MNITIYKIVFVGLSSVVFNSKLMEFCAIGIMAFVLEMTISVSFLGYLHHPETSNLVIAAAS